MLDDAALLLLSWTQVAHALLLDDNDSYKETLDILEQRLRRDFSITDITLTARAQDRYTVTYLEQDTRRTAAFAAEEVDDFA